jgi:hypothetical protein
MLVYPEERKRDVTYEIVVLFAWPWEWRKPVHEFRPSIRAQYIGE